MKCRVMKSYHTTSTAGDLGDDGELPIGPVVAAFATVDANAQHFRVDLLLLVYFFDAPNAPGRSINSSACFPHIFALTTNVSRLHRVHIIQFMWRISLF